jgi:hypothetical protein
MEDVSAMEDWTCMRYCSRLESPELEDSRVTGLDPKLDAYVTFHVL